MDAGRTGFKKASSSYLLGSKFDRNNLSKYLNHISWPKFGTFSGFRIPVERYLPVLNHQFCLSAGLGNPQKLEQFDQLNVFCTIQIVHHIKKFEMFVLFEGLIGYPSASLKTRSESSIFFCSTPLGFARGPGLLVSYCPSTPLRDRPRFPSSLRNRRTFRTLRTAHMLIPSPNPVSP